MESQSMSRLDRLLYVRKQKERERQTSFPPLERNPAWDEEDRKRWSRYPLKPEYDPNYIAPEAATEQPEPPPPPAPIIPTETQSIIGFLNAGCAEDSQYTLRSADTEDKDIYCPKAFAGPGTLPAPLADRSIPIVLQRRQRSEKVAPFCTRVIGLVTQPLVQ